MEGWLGGLGSQVLHVVGRGGGGRVLVDLRAQLLGSLDAWLGGLGSQMPHAVRRGGGEGECGWHLDGGHLNTPLPCRHIML